MHIKKNTLLMLAIISMLLLLLSCTVNKTVPEAHRGTVDLRDPAILSSGLVPLVGEWDFFWHRLYTPQNLPPLVSTWAELPGLWNDLPQTSGQDNRGSGYASYHLRILLPGQDRYAIKIREFNNSYRLWANGELLGSVGIPGESKETTRPSYRREEYYFDSGEQLDLILQVACWEHRKGGPEEYIFFGYDDDIKRLKIMLLIIDLCIGGAALVIGLYHFFLYLHRRKDKLYLVFLLLCIVILVRSFFCGEKIILNVFPEFSWHISMDIDYISIYVILPIIIALLSRMFPALNVPWLTWVYIGLAGILTLGMLLPDTIYATYTMKWFEVLAIACMIHGNIMLIIATWRRYPQALTVLIGFFILCLTAVADILFMNRIFLFHGHILHVGFSVFMAFEAFCLAGRFSQAMTANEQNLERLHQLNTSLTRFVPVEFMHFLEREAFAEGDAILHMDTDIAHIHIALQGLGAQGIGIAEATSGALDRYFARIIPQISENGGFVESLKGNKLVLLFPVSAQKAVSSCLLIHREFETISREGISPGSGPGPALNMHAGIHWGPLSGSPGHDGRDSSRCDASLIAEKVRDLATLFGAHLLLTQDVCRQLGSLDEWNMRFLCRFRVKTRLMPISVYEVFTSLPPESRALTLSTRELFEVAVQDFWHGLRDEALVSFEHVLHIHPEDASAAKYREWIKNPELFATESALLRQ